MILKILFGVDSVKDIKEYVENIFSHIDVSKTAKNSIQSIQLKDWDMWNDKSLKDRTIAKYTEQTKGLTRAEAEAVLSTKTLSDAQRQQILTNSSLIASNNGLLLTKQKLTAEQQEQLLTSGLITSTQMSQIASTLGLETAEDGALIATEALEVENVKLQLTEMGIVGTTQTQILSMLGLAGAEGTATGATGLLTKAVLALNAAWLKNPIGVIVTGILAIGAVIFGAVKIYDKFENSVDKATERLDDFDSKIKEERSTYKSHAQLVDKVSESYDKLASKVNTNTNYNLGLSDDEYTEFINLNNELAEAFPTLVKGWDDHGNAIIDFGNDCDTATEKLNELIEAEKQANNIEIAAKLPEYFDNTKTILDDYNDQIEEQEETLKNLKGVQELIYQINSGEFNLFDSNNKMAYSSETVLGGQFDKFRELTENSVEEFLGTLSDVEKATSGVFVFDDLFVYDGHGNFWLEFYKLDPDLQSRLQSIIQDNANKLAGDTQDALLDAQNALKKAESGRDATWSDFTQNLVSGMQSKASYLGLSEAGKNIADTLVGSINSNMADAIDEYEDPYEWVRENILSIISGLDYGTQGALNKAIEDYAGLDVSNLSITGQEEARQKLIDVINSLLPEEDAANLILHLGLDVETPTQEAYDSLMSDIDAVYGEGYSESSLTKNSLNYYFDKLGINTEEEILAFQKLFNETGNLTDAFEKYAEAIEKSNEALAESKDLSFSEQMSHVQSLSKGLDQLDSIMADVMDGKDFDYSSILNNTDFTETFGKYEEEYENFIETITESPDDIAKCQSAFNELATVYVHGTEALKNLTEETRDAAILELDQMGIENAQEVVDSYLELKRVKDEITNAGYDLANITYEEAYAFMNIAEASDTAKNYLFAYYAQKLMIENNGINTVQDCIQLKNLAKAAGYTGSALLYLAKIQSLLNKISVDKLVEGTLGYNSVMGQIQNYNGLLQQVINTELDVVDVTAKFAGGAETAAAKQEKLADATDKAKEALEKEKEALEDLKNEYDELYDAIQWFYDKQIDAIDDKIEAIERENEALEKQKETYDDILGAIESYYDERKQEIQDEIDKLKDSNDEQERALELEEAKRKLQEARSRKTKLIYQKGIGFTYQTDETAIKEAEETLEDLQEDEIVRRLEEELELLDEELELWQEIPEAYKKAQQEIAANKYFGMSLEELFSGKYDIDEIRKNFGDAYFNTEKKIDENDSRIESYEKEKEKLEELKEAWEEAKNAYRDAQYEAKLSSFFGSDYEFQLLNNSATWRRKFADEYSSICSQIEALEDRIKASNESTASSTEEGANKISEAANKVRESTKDLKFEIDTEVLTTAREKLKELDNEFVAGNKSISTARDLVGEFLTQYESADGCITITQELKDAVALLKEQYDGTGTSMETAINKVASDISTFETQSQTLSENLTDIDEKMKSIADSETTIEETVDTELSNTEKTISDLLLKLDELETALKEMKLATDEIEDTVDEELIDTSTVVEGIHTKVGEIQSAISLLQEAISPLEGLLDTLLEKLGQIDEITLSGIIGAFGGASSGSESSGDMSATGAQIGSSGEEGSGGSGLLGAINSVSEAIGSSSGEEGEGTGLLGLLNEVNNAPLDTIIAAFGGSSESAEDTTGTESSGSNLLSAVNSVKDAIGDIGVKNTLIGSIETLGSENVTSKIDLVKESFTDLHDMIKDCITKVEDLSKAIEAIPSATVNVSAGGTEGSGTAHFGSGTAHVNKSGKAYFKGTGNIGLSKNQPDSLIGELGTELKVSKDGSYELITSPTIMDLEKGDMIFNHEQTEEILKHGSRKNVEKLDAKANSVYTKLTGSAFAKGTMNENVFNAIMHGLKFAMNPVDVMPKFSQNIKAMPEIKNEQNLNITIGDIHVHGVQNVNGLADQIINNLPNTMLQKLNIR